MKTVRSHLVGLVCAVAALGFFAAANAATAPAAQGAAPARAMQPTEDKSFGDWSVRCYAVSSPSPCEMIELLVNKKSGQRVLGVMLVYVPSRDAHVMQVALPLGVMLKDGAVISSDTYTSGALRFNRCDVQGCYANTAVDKDTLNALGRATKAEMKFVSADGKKYNIAFSLKGFTAADSALIDLTHQKGTSAPAAAPAPASNGN